MSTALSRRLECEVAGLSSEIKTDGPNNCYWQSAILIYVSYDDVVKEEEKARSAERRKM